MAADRPLGDAGPLRLRFRYSKLGKIRFTSQRDVARMWERALRKAAVPVSLGGAGWRWRQS